MASYAQADKVSDMGQLVPSFTMWRGPLAWRHCHLSVAPGQRHPICSSAL